MNEQTFAIALPTGETIITQFNPLELKVSALQIVDAETHAEGLELGKRIKSLEKFVIELHADSKKRFNEGHKAVCAQEKKYLQPLEKTRNLLGSKLTQYEQEARRKAEENARIRQVEARKSEEERQIAEAIAAEDAGDKELAQAIIEAPVVAPVVLPQPEVSKVPGSSSRRVWGHEVQNLLMLATWVVANPDNIGLLLPNETALNAMARALKENLRIPGVRPVESIVRSYRDI